MRRFREEPPERHVADHQVDSKTFDLTGELLFQGDTRAPAPFVEHATPAFATAVP
jgi:hypothetical protein